MHNAQWTPWCAVFCLFEAPHSLHWLRRRPCSQMLPSSHSLHRVSRRPCSRILFPIAVAFVKQPQSRADLEVLPRRVACYSRMNSYFDCRFFIQTPHPSQSSRSTIARSTFSWTGANGAAAPRFPSAAGFFSEASTFTVRSGTCRIRKVASCTVTGRVQ